MMKQILRLDARGHGPVAEWGDDKAQIRAAKDMFDQHLDERYAMFRLEADGGSTKLTEFDPEAERILAVPRLQGG